MKPRRGRWLVITGLFLAAGVGWARLIQALLSWQWLVTYGAEPGPLYIAITGGLIGAAGLVAALGLLLHHPWGTPWARGYAPALALFTWADRLLFSRSTAAWAGWLIDLALTLLLVAAAWWLLRPQKPMPIPPPANSKNQ